MPGRKRPSGGRNGAAEEKQPKKKRLRTPVGSVVFVNELGDMPQEIIKTELEEPHVGDESGKYIFVRPVLSRPARGSEGEGMQRRVHSSGCVPLNVRFGELWHQHKNDRADRAIAESLEAAVCAQAKVMKGVSERNLFWKLVGDESEPAPEGLCAESVRDREHMFDTSTSSVEFKSAADYRADN